MTMTNILTRTKVSSLEFVEDYGTRPSFKVAMKQSLLLYCIILLIIIPSTCLGLASMTTTNVRFITNKMCPFAQKAWIALEVADINYTLEQVSLYGSGGKPNWFWELNPQGTVPIVVFDTSIVLPDSDLILDEISSIPGGERLEPKDETSLSHAKEFRKILAEFLPIGKKAVLGGDKKPMWAKLGELDSAIQGPYICGDEITVADCAGFPFLWRINDEFGPLGKKYGNIDGWLEHCKKNPAFTKTIQRSWWWWW